MSELDLLLELSLLKRLIGGWAETNTWAVTVEVTTSEGVTYRCSL